MTSLPQLLVDEIVRCILTVAMPERIILFGSAATGTMNRDSDIDLLVIGRFDDPKNDRLKIRYSLNKIGYPFDIITVTPERFDERRDIIGTVIYPAVRFGRVIYERAG